jgi:hypothetical protein
MMTGWPAVGRIWVSMPSSRIIEARSSAHSLTPSSWALMLFWRTSVFNSSSIGSAC